MDIDTRRLQVFLTVARELHFSRAAKLLHISQSALSQQILGLERDLQVTLFVRTSRQVELTPAGRALLDLAPRALWELERAIETARQAAVGWVGGLVVGSVRTGLAGILPSVMRALRDTQPELRLEVYHMDTEHQLRALVDRRIEIGIVRAAPPTAALVIEPLTSEPLVLALPADHPLAGSDAIDPRSLAGERFVSWPRHLGADFFDIVIAYCREHGFSPDVVAEGEDIDTQLALVAAGVGVSLQPSYYGAALPDGIVLLPLRGAAPAVDLQLAWRHDAPPAVAHFVDAARQVVGG